LFLYKTLTLNSTSASLGSSYCLGTLNPKLINWEPDGSFLKEPVQFFKNKPQEWVFMTGSCSCENQRLVFNLVLTCNYVNQFPLWEPDHDLRTTQHWYVLSGITSSVNMWIYLWMSSEQMLLIYAHLSLLEALEE